MGAEIIVPGRSVDMADSYYVYARTLEPLVQAAERNGVDLEPAFAAVSFSPSDLEQADNPIQWSEFVVWCERFEQLIAPHGGLDEIGRGMTGSSYEGILRGFLGLFASPRWVFALMQRWFGPSLFPMVTTSYEERDGEIWVTINFPPDMIHEPIFYRICRIIFMYAPTLINSQPAHVEVSHEDGEGVFRIIPPPSATILSRLKRAWLAIFSRGVVLDELTLQHDRLVSNYRSLQTAHDELERSANLLHESERRLLLATEATEDGVFEIGANDEIIFASKRAAAILRFDSIDELTFDAWKERIDDADKVEFEQTLRMLKENTVETIGLEHALRHRGQLYHVSMRATCDDRNGEERIVGSLSDITTRVRQQKKLTRSEANFRTLIDESPQSIFVFGSDGVTRYANRVFSESLGLDTEDIRGTAVSGLTLNEKNTLDSKLGRREVQFVHSDGSVRIFDLAVVEIAFDQEAAFMAVGRDVTEEKEFTARLREMDRMVAVGTLAAGVAHEINNPLAYIQSNVEYSKRELARIADATDDLETRTSLLELEDALGDSLNGTRRVRDIVRDLKGFSHEETDVVEPVDLEKVIVSSVNMAWHEVRQRALLETEFQDIPPVRANQSRMGQVLLNLIVNAAQAIDPGDPTGNRIVIRTSVDGEYGVVEILDTGRGIPKEKFSQIFDPFFTTKPVGEGTGLGLSISRNVVKRFDGMIEFESTEGVGTVARIKLPLSEQELNEVESQEDVPHELIDEEARSILVIDDDVNIGTMMQRILSKRYKVIYMQSGVLALDHLADSDEFYDLIISDQMMPGFSGVEVYEELLRVNPRYRDRFALMTGGTIRMSDEGPPVLSKPFGTRELRDFLREQFERLDVRTTAELVMKDLIQEASGG